MGRSSATSYEGILMARAKKQASDNVLLHARQAGRRTGRGNRGMWNEICQGRIEENPHNIPLTRRGFSQNSLEKRESRRQKRKKTIGENTQENQKR